MSLSTLCLYYMQFWNINFFSLISICISDLRYICSSLQVNWDVDADTNQQNRISPWEIEPTGSVSVSGSLSTVGSKRAKIGLPSVNMDFPIPSRSLMCLIIETLQSSITFPALFLMLVCNWCRWKWLSRLEGICKYPQGLARSRIYETQCSKLHWCDSFSCFRDWKSSVLREGKFRWCKWQHHRWICSRR